MKKKLWLLLVLAGSILCALFGLTACDFGGGNGGNENEKPSIHIHNLIIHDAIAPTCSKAGKRIYYTCSDCNMMFNDKYASYNIEDPVSLIIPATGKHEWRDNVCIVCKYDAGGSKQLKMSQWGNTVTVLGIGNCTDKEIVIPETYNGKPVTSIGDSAFYGCSSLTSVTIPESMINIGDSAFYGCSSLTNISIPDNVAIIGNKAFDECNLLKYNEYNNGYYLGNEKNPYVALMSKTSTEINSVSIHRSTKVIGYMAFNNCSSLTSIVIPDGVTSIGVAAFAGCYSLISIAIPDSVKVIEWHTFYNCSSLTSVVIPDSVTSIGWGTFHGCSSLTSLVIPDSVTSIGAEAFLRCSSLTSLVIPDSVTSIEDTAFSGCSSLTSIVVEENNQNYASQDGILYDKEKTRFIHIPKAIIGEVTIPDSVASIGEWKFSGCSSLTNVTIPDSVTSIGERAFEDCDSLTSVTIGNGVTSIDWRAFYNCSSLTNITYRGTKAEWEVIEKGDSWDSDAGSYTIHCTDGDIKKGE